MCNFSIGGKSYSTLDYDVMLRKPRRSFKKGYDFEKRAEEELLLLEGEDYLHQFINVYSDCGYTFHTGETEKSLSLSLVGQDYVCRPAVKQIRSCGALAVYYTIGDEKPKRLWTLNRFAPQKTPVFLNRKELTKALRPLFATMDISLGLLTDKAMKAIAWQIKTDKGTFFIPWHSGCLVEGNDFLEFTEKPFREMREIYKCLRFAPDVMDMNVFRILTA